MLIPIPNRMGIFCYICTYMNYATDSTTQAMVYGRLSFLSSPTDDNAVNLFIYEIMSEINGALAKTTVGDDADYTIAERALIADLAAYYLVMNKASQLAFLAAGGGSSSESPATIATFLKKAKAGSVEVEYGNAGDSQINTSKWSAFAMGSEALLAQLKSSAYRKSRALGFIVDIVEDGSIYIRGVGQTEIPPFTILQT